MGTGNRAVWNKGGGGGERGGKPWSRGKLEKPGGGNMGTRMWRVLKLVGVGAGRGWGGDTNSGQNGWEPG